MSASVLSLLLVVDTDLHRPGLEVKLLCHDLAANLTITRSAYALTYTYIAC